jgi:hypothetical protein
MLFTTFAFFAALVGGAYAAPTSGRTVIQAPQGSGQIIVSQTQLRVTGCLNAAGLWNVAGDCATFSGDDDGAISGPEGYLVLTADSGITTLASSDTTWLGYYLNGNVGVNYCFPCRGLPEPMRTSIRTDALPLDRHPPHTSLPTKPRWMVLLDKSYVSTRLGPTFQSKCPFCKKKILQKSWIPNSMKLPRHLFAARPVLTWHYHSTCKPCTL